MATKKVMEPRNVGVINPFALAELVAGKPIDWQKEDPREVLTDTLHLSYEMLFDPANDSPLYAGLRLNSKTFEMEQVETPEAPQVLAEPVVEEPVETDQGFLSDDAIEPQEVPLEAMVEGATRAARWLDPGDFMNEAVEMADPVQGALGDCYFIAAMSSVAWARTYAIAHWARATGLTNEEFVDMVPFYDDSGKEARVEVTEKIPLNFPSNTYIYARSRESGEIWPAVLEKAYAKWRTHHAGDFPDYAPLAGGDPVRACQQLIGGKRNYKWTSATTAATIWNTVRGHCISRKTFDPMVAWTYSSGQASPDKVNYSSAHIAANHAYSLLGWDYVGGEKYLVLRNPWGSYEATEDIYGGYWYAWDAPYYGGPGWWRRTKLAEADGVFSIKVAAFKKYFAGFGWIAGGKR